MARVALKSNIVARSPQGPVLTGSKVYLYEHGTTDLIDVYEEETGPETISQPLVIDRFGYPPGWAPPQRLDAKIGSSDIIPVELGGLGTTLLTGELDGRIIGEPTDTHFADAALEALANGELTPVADAFPYFTGPDAAALTALTAFARRYLAAGNASAFRDAVSEIIAEPNAAPGSGSQYTARAGLHIDPFNLRMLVQAALHVVEINDPAELHLRRAPGRNQAQPTGGIALYRKTLGESTVVAADFLAGATDCYIRKQDSLPTALTSQPANSSFKVGSQVVTFTSRVSVSSPPAAAALGATEIYIADASSFPSAAWARSRFLNLAYTGKSSAYSDTTLAGGGVTNKAGTTSLRVGSTITGIPSAGWIRAGGQTVQYSSFTGQVFTLTKALNVNIADSVAVTMDKLTGLTSEFEAYVDGDHAAGSSTLKLNLENDGSNLWANVPSSGFVRFETTVDPTGPGLRDHPVKRMAYTAKGADGTLTLSGTLPSPVTSAEDSRDACWIWVEGYPGLCQALPNGRSVQVGKLSGCGGLTNADTRGSLVSFDPRYRAPTAKGNHGFLAADGWSDIGYEGNDIARIAFTSLEDTVGAKNRGGQMIFHTMDVATKLRRVIAQMHPSGISITGENFLSDSQISAALCVGGPQATITEAGATELDPDFEDPGGGQFGASIIYVSTIARFPTSGRLSIIAYNAVAGANETREFDYTGTATTGGTAQFTGVTYDGADGYSLSDFWMHNGISVVLAPRVKKAVIKSSRQIQAGSGVSGSQATIGNVGPTATGPEPGLEAGLSNPITLHRHLSGGSPDGKWAQGYGGTEKLLATEDYVDLATTQSMKFVRAATTANITLSGTQTVDTIALVVGDRCLVKDQTDPTKNGPYVVASGAWTRASDFDTAAELQAGLVYVNEGTQARTIWRETTTPITLGTSNIVWTKAFDLADLAAGAGLTRSGDTFNVGAGDGIQADADSVTTKLDGATLSKSASGLKVADSTFQPLDADLTALAALSTDSFGRALLEKTSAALIRTYLDAAQSSDVDARYRRLPCPAGWQARASNVNAGAAVYPLTPTGGAAAPLCRTASISSTSGPTSTFRAGRRSCGSAPTARPTTSTPGATLKLGLYPSARRAVVRRCGTPTSAPAPRGQFADHPLDPRPRLCDARDPDRRVHGPGGQASTPSPSMHQRR
jgi:hypothetical protein